MHTYPLHLGPISQSWAGSLRQWEDTGDRYSRAQPLCRCSSSGLTDTNAMEPTNADEAKAWTYSYVPLGYFVSTS